MEMITDSTQLIGKMVKVKIYKSGEYRARKLINIEAGGLLFDGNEKDHSDAVFILNEHIEAIFLPRKGSDDNDDDDDDDG